MKRETLTPDFLRSILDYDPLSGLLFWKIARSQKKVGSVAGSKHYNGYIRIGINNSYYMAHRIAWVATYGQWPVGFIDHINRNKSDNRLSNLRVATQSENQGNIGLTARNKSGYRGVSWRKREQKWSATIRFNNHLRHLGRFDCPKEAARAYNQAAVDLFGEFAFLNGGVSQ